MHHFQDHIWPDLIIPYYHNIFIKIPTLGKHSVKNEEINARAYRTDDITENLVTECFLKVQNPFLIHMAKISGGKWYMDG